MPKSQFSEAYKAFMQVMITARKEAGLTQVEVARRIGRRQTHISIIETGVRRLDLIEFCALSRAMGVEPVILFERVVAALPEKLDV